MSKVFSAHAVSVDGYISGRAPDGDEEFGHGLGDAPMLFDWYADGDTPSHVFDGCKRSEPARLFVVGHRPAPEISETQTLLQAVPAPGVTHLHHEVVR